MFFLGALANETLEAATVLMRSLHVKKAWAGFSQKKHIQSKSAMKQFPSKMTINS